MITATEVAHFESLSEGGVAEKTITIVLSSLTIYSVGAIAMTLNYHSHAEYGFLYIKHSFNRNVTWVEM